jgi:filamentous hemagglutinin family protein
VIPLPPGDGGGVIIGGGGVIIGGSTVAFESFEIGTGALATLQPTGPAALRRRVTRGLASTLEGRLQVDPSAVLLDPAGVGFASASAPAPTLAELGITAPSGAEVSFDPAGALSVFSTGDLIVAGGMIDLPGLTSVTLQTPGRITIEGSLELPPGVNLSIDAGEVVIAGDLSGPGDGGVDPLPPIAPSPFCSSLLATFPPDERELAHITLVATAAQPIEIEVEPRHDGRPGHARHGVVEVAILGSEDFDIRDVEERSLRLGPAEAEPTRHRGLGRTRRVDVDRDGETDLLVRFDAQESGIPGGGDELCLWGETRDGRLVEGCDTVASGLEREWRGRSGCQDEDD